jgi:hypothetical protein
MGWISFNSSDCDTNNDGKNDNALCGAVNSVITSYGVNFPSGDGDITGYAWSEYYGWISFNGGGSAASNAGDLAGCTGPAVLGQARRVGNALTGGARIMAIKTAVAAGNAGGYDGCIDLSTATIDTGDNTLNGNFWSSDLGWIYVNDVKVFLPLVDLKIKDSTNTLIDGPVTDLREPATLNLSWTSTDADNCNATAYNSFGPIVGGSWSGAKLLNNAQSISGITRGDYLYTLTCSKGAFSQTDSVFVSIPTPKANLSSAGCSVANDASACDATVIWDYENATERYDVKNVTTGTPYLTDSSSEAPGSAVENLKVGPYVVNAYHNTGTLLETINLNIACGGVGYIVNPDALDKCQFPPPPPVITITPTPALVRSGAKAKLKIDIVSAVPLSCTIYGITRPEVPVLFLDHDGTIPTNTYYQDTKTLNNAQAVKMHCTVIGFSSVFGDAEARIDVVPTIQEI